MNFERLTRSKESRRKVTGWRVPLLRDYLGVRALPRAGARLSKGWGNRSSIGGDETVTSCGDRTKFKVEAWGLTQQEER